MAQRTDRYPGNSLPPRRQPAKPRLPAELPAASSADIIEDDSVIRSLAFEGADFSQLKAASIEIESSRFKSVTFAQGSLDRAIISDSELAHCDLANMAARESSLVRVTVKSSRLTGTRLEECGIRDSLFESCRMGMATFRFTKFASSIFSDCKLGQANFQSADLRGARFENCDLTGAQFSNANMDGTVFDDCKLYDLNGITSLKGAIVKNLDAMALLYSLAGALGIRITDD
jgi:uncharacterized protein YjbI with pentapeptide repeats